MKPKILLCMNRTAIVLLITTIAFEPVKAWAQNHEIVSYEAAAAYDAYNKNFLVESQGSAYYNTKLVSLGTSESGTWVSALDISVAQDNYDVTHSHAALQLVSDLMDRFVVKNGTEWSWDGWNDDIGWMVSAFVRGYQITGNKSYLTIAEKNWNMACDRGWDAASGGIWENTDKHTKCALSNDPFVWEGVWLSQATGDSTYLTKAERIYDWARTHVANCTDSANSLGKPGQVNEGITASGDLQPSDNMYNNGSFLEAADVLFKATGNPEYIHDATLDISHVISDGPVLHSGAEAPGNQWAYWFVKALTDFCNDTSAWNKYLPWLLDNANSAWKVRDSLDLTWNDWTSPTNDAGTDAIEMSSAADIWQLLKFPQECQIINRYTGLAMGLTNDNKADGAEIDQWVSNPNDPDQHWILMPVSDGHYAIISAVTGMAAAFSTVPVTGREVLVDHWFSINDASEQYDLVLGSDGDNVIQNVGSGMVLNDYHGEATNGTKIVPLAADGRPNQTWKIVQLP
jgi:hypothetical protein